MGGHSLVSASRTTHLKIAFVAAAASGLVIFVAATAQLNRLDVAAHSAGSILKVNKTVTTARSDELQIR